MSGEAASTSREWILKTFAQSNPDGNDRENIPALLRRVAETIESLGPVDVDDIFFGYHEYGEDPFVKVYYSVQK